MIKRRILSIKNRFLQLVASILYKKRPVENTKIVFDNFIGKGYGGNPKYIAEELIRLNPHFDLVWLCKDTDEPFPNFIRVVKYGSLSSLEEYYTAKVWIDNVRNSFKPYEKKDEQVYLQTWHGLLAFKNIEGQVPNLDLSYKTQAIRDGKMCDAILSSNSEMTSIMNEYFWIQDNSKILLSGSPESDVFFSVSLKENLNQKIRSRYGISSDTTIVLYMPTFRDDLDMNVYDINYRILQNTIENRINNNCVLLIRMHPNIKMEDNNALNKCVIDVSDYPDANELLNIADWLISDYSSVIYVSVLLKKPSFLYVPDLYEYQEKRGLNSCYDSLPCSKSLTFNDLIDSINDFDYEEYSVSCEQYEKLVEAYNKGNSSRCVANWITDHI